LQLLPSNQEDSGNDALATVRLSPLARAEFLSRASLELSSLLEPDAIFDRTARLGLALFGRFAIVLVQDDANKPQSHLIVHQDAAKEAHLRETAQRYAPLFAHVQGWQDAAASLRGVVEPRPGEATPAWLDHFDAASVLWLPISARGRLLAVIAFFSADKRFTGDLDLAERLAERAGLSADNARLYQSAQRAIRARDDLLAIVAHDLRNPLNAILLTVEAAIADSEPLSEIELDTIRRAAKRMGVQIRDLLDAASIEAGRLTMNMRTWSMSTILSETLQLFEPIAKAQGVFLCSREARREVHIRCDKGRIVQVLSNLVGNAIKFTERGGVISINVSCSEREVLVETTDTGAGISEERLTHIFDRYWRPADSNQSGTGLGLYIAKGIVEAHQGILWAESQVGHGSNFLFTLPLADAKREDPARFSERMHQPTHDKPLVLVVDDEEDIRNILKSIITKQGYDVVTAAHGAEALAYLRTHAKPRLILLDLTMPVMNGMQFIAERRRDANLATVPVVVMSADREAQPWCINQNLDYWAKPLDFETLVRALKQRLG
jgi:signal transduction histidine kinase